MARIILFFHLIFSSKQTDLYEETFRDLVDNVLSGFNGTIFAYGQTGTGKTFTMQGWYKNSNLTIQFLPSRESIKMAGILTYRYRVRLSKLIEVRTASNGEHLILISLCTIGLSDDKIFWMANKNKNQTNIGSISMNLWFS